MRLTVQRIDAVTWEESFAANAHRAVFDEHLPPGLERIDFAALVIDAATATAVGYLTCRELDGESLYLKRGGAFPAAHKNVHALPAYRCAIDYLSARYRRLTTLVENRNASYLKLALTVGFRPIGIRCFGARIFVELLKGDE